MMKSSQVWISILLVAFATVAASAQSFRVQCPPSTLTHPGTNSTAEASLRTTARRNLRPARADTLYRLRGP